MKCSACNYQYFEADGTHIEGGQIDVDPITEDEIPFIEIPVIIKKEDTPIDHELYHLGLGEEILLACPKCKTLRIK